MAAEGVAPAAILPGEDGGEAAALFRRGVGQAPEGGALHGGLEEKHVALPGHGPGDALEGQGLPLGGALLKLWILLELITWQTISIATRSKTSR